METMVRVADIVPGPNDRRDFRHVPGLAQSIRKAGLLQAISVRPLIPPRPQSVTVLPATQHAQVLDSAGIYEIVGGESRWQAHVLLGEELIRAQIVEAVAEDDATASWLMLLENTARADLNSLEEAYAFRKRLQNGSTVDEIGEYTGKRPGYIERRLDLLEVRPDIAQMIAGGQLPLTYAGILKELDVNRQLIAIRRLDQVKKDGFAPTIEYFKQEIVGPLLQDQNQAGFDFGLFGGGSMAPAIEVEAPRIPDDPTTFSPRVRPGLDPLSTVQALIAEWNALLREWERYGDRAKTAQCETVIANLESVAGMLATALVTETPHAKVIRLLRERGSMSTRELLQYANMLKPKLQPVLDDLVDGGQINRRRSGRGFRYALA